MRRFNSITAFSALWIRIYDNQKGKKTTQLSWKSYTATTHRIQISAALSTEELKQLTGEMS